MKTIDKLCLFVGLMFAALVGSPAFAAVGSWNGVAFTAWDGVGITSWNGTSISTAASGYTANLVGFAGDGQCRMERDGGLTGAADGIDGIFSCFYDSAVDGTPQWILLNDDFRVAIGKQDSNDLFIRVQSAAGVTLAQTTTTVTLTAAGGRKHIFVSWHIASTGGFIKIYIDRVDRSSVLVPPVLDVAVDYTPTDWGVGDLPGGYQPLNGSVSEVYFNTLVSADPATAGVLDHWVTAGLAPVDIGADTTYGTAGTYPPIIYLKTAGTGFTTNSGTGGNFVKKGTTALTNDGTF